MDSSKQMISDDATTRLRMESYHSEYDSQTISNEELHQKLEEDIHETLKIGPFSVWARGNCSSKIFQMKSQSVGFADTFYAPVTVIFAA